MDKIFSEDLLEELQQETLFIADPHGNCLEIKTMKNPETLFRKNN